MLHKTRGIVFRFTKYGETSIIVSIFTELFGLQTYIVNGVRTKSAKNKIALFQPLTLLDLVVYHRENAEILRIKEVKCFYAYQTIHTDIRKSTIAMFLNEFLNKSVKDESHASEITQFLFDSLISLDQAKSAENFHLIFLLKLSRYLGFLPQNTEEISRVWVLTNEEEQLMKRLLIANYETEIAITNVERRNLLEAVLHFYMAHIDNFGEIKSVQVLKELFN